MNSGHNGAKAYQKNDGDLISVLLHIKRRREIGPDERRSIDASAQDTHTVRFVTSM
jgi:hypothetical protein